MPCKTTFLYLSLSAILIVTKCQNVVESSEIINNDDEKDYTPDNDGITADNPNPKSQTFEMEPKSFNNEDLKFDPITHAKEDNQSVPKRPITRFRDGELELISNENINLYPITSAKEDNQSVPKTPPTRIRDGDRPFKYYRKGIKTRNSVTSGNVQKGLLKMVKSSSVEDASFDFKKVGIPSDGIEERIIKPEPKKRPRFKLRKKNHALRLRNKNHRINNNKNNGDSIPTEIVSETQQYPSHSRRSGSPVLFMRNHGSSSGSEVGENNWSASESEKENLQSDHKSVESMKIENSSQENILTRDRPVKTMTNDADTLNEYHEILSSAGENAADDSNKLNKNSFDTKAFIADTHDESSEKTSSTDQNNQTHLSRDVDERTPLTPNEDKVHSQINNDNLAKPQTNANYNDEYNDDFLEANNHNEANEKKKSTTFQRPEPQQRDQPSFEIPDEKRNKFDVLGWREVVATSFQGPLPPEEKHMYSEILNKEQKGIDSSEEKKETTFLQKPIHQERRQFRYEENRKNLDSLEEKQRGTLSQKPFVPEERPSYLEGHHDKNVNHNFPMEDESSVSQSDLAKHTENREVKLNNEKSIARETPLGENLYEDPSESKINYKDNRIPTETPNLNTYSNDFKTFEEVNNFDKFNNAPSFNSGTSFGANPPRPSFYQNSFKSNAKPNFPSNKNTQVIKAALMSAETQPTDFRKFEQSKKSFNSLSNVYPFNQEISNNENYNVHGIPTSTLRSLETSYNYQAKTTQQPLFSTYSEGENSQALDTQTRYQKPSTQDYPNSYPHQTLKDAHHFEGLEGHTSREQPKYSYQPNLNNFQPSKIQPINRPQNNFQEEQLPHLSQEGFSSIHQLNGHVVEEQQNEQQNQLPIFSHQEHQLSIGQLPNNEQQYHEVDYEGETETSPNENIKSTDEHYRNSFESQGLLEEDPEQLLHSIQPSEFEYENQQEEIQYKSNPEDYEVSSFQEPPNQQSFSYHNTKNLVFPQLNQNSNKPIGNQNPFEYFSKESEIQEGPSTEDHQQILSVGHSNFQNSRRGSQNTASVHHLQPLFKETRTENVQHFNEPVIHLNPLFKEIRTETAQNFNQPKINNNNNGIATANMHFKLMSPYVEV